MTRGGDARGGQRRRVAANDGRAPERPATDPGADREAGRARGLEPLGSLLPGAARRLGLEEELALATAMSTWARLVRERVPSIAGRCRLVSLERGVAVVETEEPIVGQEIRLRSFELLAGLRAGVAVPIRELRVTVRNV